MAGDELPPAKRLKSSHLPPQLRDAKRKDIDNWETNRMLTSGVAQRRDFDDDFMPEDEEGTRVHLLVHDLRPPFLDGRTIFTKQLEPVSAVRDPQSDMAVFSRKGSKVVRERRQQRERQKQAQEATTMAGTALGNLIGIREDEGDSAVAAPVEDAYKGGNKFAQHLKKDEGGASAFSKSKTLREQREFLPAFAVREDLLRVIRDNQVVVVIGETGSGKTTQLTQFLYEDGYGKFGLIGCTQPRRVAAMSVAKRVSEEMEVDLGGLVGYAIRFEDCTTDQTVIKCERFMPETFLVLNYLTDSMPLSRYDGWCSPTRVASSARPGQVLMHYHGRGSRTSLEYRCFNGSSQENPSTKERPQANSHIRYYEFRTLLQIFRGSARICDSWKNISR